MDVDAVDAVDLGYVFHPHAASDALGYAQLDVFLTDNGDVDAYLPKQIDLWALTGGGEVVEETVTHQWNDDAPLRVAPGLVAIGSHEGGDLQAYCLGGLLTPVDVGKYTHCRLTSPAPLFNLSEEGSSDAQNAVLMLVNEIESAIARLRAGAGAQRNTVDARLARADPRHLYAAGLVLARGAFKHIPEMMRTENYWNEYAELGRAYRRGANGRLVANRSGVGSHHPQGSRTMNRSGAVVVSAAVVMMAVLFGLLPAYRPALQSAQAAPMGLVDFVWSGGVTAHSARVVVRVPDPSARVRLAVSAVLSQTAPVIWTPESFTPITSGEQGAVAAFALENLASSTEYSYAVQVDGQLDSQQQGRFRTFAEGSASFDFVVSGDAQLGSNAPVFDTIAALKPDLYLNSGDFFCADIADNSRDKFRAAFNTTLRQSRQANLYRSAPIAYMWDDHDYGPNDSDSTSPSRTAARLTYREYVPHYPLPAGSGDAPIYQAFTIGRARFIMTDLRSERDVASAPDNAGKTMMGAAQKAWFKQELLAANGVYPVIFWVSSVPWISAAVSPTVGGPDNWSVYATERREIADFIVEHDVQGLIMLAADAHMLALDDGENNHFAAVDSPAQHFPVLQSAALNRAGSAKGGPYTTGVFPNPSEDDGQFALVTVDDAGGDQVCVHVSGRRLPAGATATAELINWSRCFDARSYLRSLPPQASRLVWRPPRPMSIPRTPRSTSLHQVESLPRLRHVTSTATGRTTAPARIRLSYCDGIPPPYRPTAWWSVLRWCSMSPIPRKVRTRSMRCAVPGRSLPSRGIAPRPARPGSRRAPRESRIAAPNRSQRWPPSPPVCTRLGWTLPAWPRCSNG